ncbi:hypothetical protein BDV06DRAFT_215512 [Aspergillus oleicola]
METNIQTWLAKPSGQCCLKGTLHSGTPQGEIRPVAGVETYISRPSNPNGYILLYFPDVWGMFTNGLLVMDGFADAGYTVLGLDYFRGDPVWKHRKNRHDNSNLDFDYEAWKNKHTSFADEAMPRWVEAVKRGYGRPGTKYACIGYCFGAPYICDLLATDAISAGAFAHPAFLQERHFAKLQKPLFLSCSEKDHTFPTAARRKSNRHHERKRQQTPIAVILGVEHGFALRGNMEDSYERYVKEQTCCSLV